MNNKSDLDQWVDHMIEGSEGKPSHIAKNTATDIVMQLINNKVKLFKEDIYPNKKFNKNQLRLIKALAKFHNDLGYKNNFDFMPIEMEDLNNAKS